MIMPNKNTLITASAVLIFGVILWAADYNRKMTSAANQALQTTEETMKPNLLNTAVSSPIPTIDITIPDIFETATFGLG